MTFSGFVTPDDARWTSALRACAHDFYHVPAYVALEAQWVGATPLAFLHAEHDGTMLLVLHERPTPSGRYTDATTPYGYPAPVWSRTCDDSFRQRALAAYDNAARGRGLVATFMRLHPVLQPSIEAHFPQGDGAWSEVQRGVTLLMPLEKNEDAFLAGMAHGHRADLRRLQRSGARVVAHGDAVWSAFADIYLATMHKIGAAPSLCYSPDYFAKLRRALGEQLICAAVVDASGEPMCAALFSLVGDTMQYHLSGTVPKFARLAPVKLLLVEMRKLAIGKGVAWFHLGGGLGSGRDALHAFKQRFGGAEIPFATVSVLHDRAASEAEWEWVCKQEGMGAIPPVASFFPPYRARISTGGTA